MFEVAARPLLTLSLVSALVGAGCLGLDDPAATLPPDDPAQTLAFLEIAGTRIGSNETHTWQGRELKAKTSETGTPLPVSWLGLSSTGPLGECTPSNCERIPFTLDIPPGHWDTHDGFVEFTLALTPGDGPYHFAFVDIYDDEGNEVALSRGGQYTQIARMEEPASGSYEARFWAAEGEGPYTGIVQFDSAPARPEPDARLLPNLVTLVPRDLKVELPRWGNGPLVGIPEAVRGAAAAADAGSCAADETAEGQAVRCLRLTNGIGNLGQGPLEVHLTVDQFDEALVAEGQFYQYIHHGDGSVAQRQVSNAYFHPTHAHMHYQGLASYQLYAYDLDTGTRGETIGKGQKAGFCLVDEGLVDPASRLNRLAGYSGFECLVPEEGKDFYMGLTPGWFDMYETYRSDQYIEITGVPDGVYELVSTVNEDGSIEESSHEDNEASVVLRLAGTEVEVLEERGADAGLR